ncbi:MAG: histidine phosphatase family protein [Traorella sp.]
MLSLYIVRHGQTLFNQKKKIQGWCDSPLTKEGILQARKLGQGLKDVDFVSCYSSTSERAIDTATYILENRDIEIHSTKKLKEMNFGEIEGESEMLLTQHLDLLMSKGMDAFGGETIKKVSQRMYSAIEEIRNECDEGNVLVVSHGGSILTLLCSLDKQISKELLSKDSKGIQNCSVSILDYDKQEWKVREYNNLSYQDICNN